MAMCWMEGVADIDKETQTCMWCGARDQCAVGFSGGYGHQPAGGFEQFRPRCCCAGRLMVATTREFQIHGSREDPQVTQLPRRAGAQSRGDKSAPAFPAEAEPKPAPKPAATEETP